MQTIKIIEPEEILMIMYCQYMIYISIVGTKPKITRWD